MLTEGSILQKRYRVIRQLAKGGMGAVYEALDMRLDAAVALKETLFTDELLRKQFEREARLLARLHHPALPRVSDHFIESGGQFLVMQLITGDDLEELRKKNGGSFDYEMVLGWADQLLDALDYIHTQERPIIHRDIKPQNIKLTRRGQVILLDFGLAKGSALATSRATTPDSVPGFTLSYAPPEQIQGIGTEPRSDLYSLAATLYHLILGERPPDAYTRGSTAFSGQPDPLLPIHTINKSVPPAVSGVLYKAMALDREGRPATAAQMRTALNAARRVGFAHAADESTLVDLPSPVASHGTLVPDSTMPLPKQVLARQNQLTENQRLHLEFWTAFRSFIEQQNTSLTPTKPLPQYWMDFFPFSRSGFKLVAYDGMRDKWIGVDLTLSGPNAKSHFAALSREKDVIEKAIGAPLEWREQENQKQRYIALKWMGVNPADPDDWPRQHAWLLEKLEVFYRTLAPYISGLKDGGATPALESGPTLEGTFAGGNQEQGTVAATPSAPPLKPDSVLPSSSETQEQKGERAERAPAGVRAAHPEQPTGADSTPKRATSANRAAMPSQRVSPKQIAHTPLLRKWWWVIAFLVIILPLSIWMYLTLPTAKQPGDPLAPGASTANSGASTVGTAQWAIERRLEGHTQKVTAVSFSPDGSLLASASDDSTVKIWQVQQWQLVRTLSGFGDSVNMVAFSIDGKMLVTTGRDGWIRWWDTATWTEHKIIRSRLEGSEIRFSANGKCLIVDVHYNNAHVYALPGMTLRRSFYYGRNSAIWSMDISPDCNLLAAVGGPFVRDLKIWNIQTGQQYPAPKLTNSSSLSDLGAVTFQPDGRMLLVSSQSGSSVKFVDLTSFKVVKSFQVPASKGMLYSPDGRLLACIDYQKITLVDAATGVVMASLNNGSNNFYKSIAFSPDSRLIATPSDSNHVLLWRQIPPS